MPDVLILRLVAVVIGLVVTVATVRSAIRTFILPRGARDGIVTFVFLQFRRLLRVMAPDSASFERRDRVLAYYAPVGLVVTTGCTMSIVAGDAISQNF